MKYLNALHRKRQVLLRVRYEVAILMPKNNQMMRGRLFS